jgi:hypothetical protein
MNNELDLAQHMCVQQQACYVDLVRQKQLSHGSKQGMQGLCMNHVLDLQHWSTLCSEAGITRNVCDNVGDSVTEAASGRFRRRIALSRVHALLYLLLRLVMLTHHIKIRRCLCVVLQILESIAIPVNLEDKESLIRAANT